MAAEESILDPKEEPLLATEPDSNEKREVPPWAKGRTLRNVERDVLVPKIMREQAKIRCKELVDEFKACIKGRTVSMLWNCMQQNNAMKGCLEKHYQDPEFFEACKEVYLQQRDKFQEVWVETGKTKMPSEKKEPYTI